MTNNNSSHENRVLDPKLSQHIENRPSVFGNSFVVMIVLIIFYILGITFFAVGIGLISEFAIRSDIASDFLSEKIYDIFELPTKGKDAIRDVFLFLGITCSSIGLLFLLIARLTRMVLKRNAFILNLLIIKDELEEENKTPNS